MAQEKQVILIPEYLSVRELAELIDASPIEVMKQLMAMTKITIDQIIITDSQYGRKKGVRVHQIWKREK